MMPGPQRESSRLTVIKAGTQKVSKVNRLTTDDITSEEGMQKAMQAMHDDEIVLWVPFPCTGQHAWKQLDQQHLNRCDMKEARQALFSSLREPLRLVAEECL